MLFISVLLSIWFVCWLVYAIFIKDTGKLLAAWLEDMYEDKEDTEEIDAIIEKSPDKCAYHLSCGKCNRTWWSTEANVNFCPFCGEKRS